MDEDPHVKSWDEPMYSIQHIGIEETYGFGILNEGQAIAVPETVSSCGSSLLFGQSGRE